MLTTASTGPYPAQYELSPHHGRFFLILSCHLHLGVSVWVTVGCQCGLLWGVSMWVTVGCVSVGYSGVCQCGLLWGVSVWVTLGCVSVGYSGVCQYGLL